MSYFLEQSRLLELSKNLNANWRITRSRSLKVRSLMRTMRCKTNLLVYSQYSQVRDDILSYNGKGIIALDLDRLVSSGGGKGICLSTIPSQLESWSKKLPSYKVASTLSDDEAAKLVDAGTNVITTSRPGSVRPNAVVIPEKSDIYLDFLKWCNRMAILPKKEWNDKGEDREFLRAPVEVVYYLEGFLSWYEVVIVVTRHVEILRWGVVCGYVPCAIGNISVEGALITTDSIKNLLFDFAGCSPHKIPITDILEPSVQVFDHRRRRVGVDEYIISYRQWLYVMGIKDRRNFSEDMMYTYVEYPVKFGMSIKYGTDPYVLVVSHFLTVELDLTWQQLVLVRDLVAAEHGYTRLSFKRYAKVVDGKVIGLDPSGHLLNLLLLSHFCPVCWRLFLDNIEWNIRAYSGDGEARSIISSIRKDKYDYLIGLCRTETPFALWHNFDEYWYACDMYEICVQSLGWEVASDYLAYIRKRLLIFKDKYKKFDDLSTGGLNISRGVADHLSLGYSLESYSLV